MEMEGLSTWDTEPGQWYRYNGKERDTLSGWTDFGARWGILEIGRWNGVDPLADKYYGWSPFSSMLNNPISFVDPTGMSVEDYDHEYTIDKDGRVQKAKHVEGSKVDNLHTKENWDSGKLDKSITVNDQKLLASLDKNHGKLKVKTYWGERSGTYANTSNRADAFKVFKFASDNSDVEWGLLGAKNGKNTIGTLYENAVVGGLLKVSGFDLNNLSFDYHSHPGGSSKTGDSASEMGDISTASGQVSKLLKLGVSYDDLPRYYIYRPHVDKPYRFEYSPWENKFNVKSVYSWKNL